MVKLLFFGKLMDAAGTGEKSVVLPPQVKNVAALKSWLMATDTYMKSAFDRAVDLRVTVNKDFADDTTPVPDSAEVAFISFKG